MVDNKTVDGGYLASAFASRHVHETSHMMQRRYGDSRRPGPDVTILLLAGMRPRGRRGIVYDVGVVVSHPSSLSHPHMFQYASIRSSATASHNC